MPTPSLSLFDFVRNPLAVFAWAQRFAGSDAAELDVDEHPDLGAIRREVGRLIGEDPDTLRDALDALLTRDTLARELECLQTLGVIAVLLPEVAALVGFHTSCPVHHKDLWAHTLRVIEKIPADPDLRWAALMHDAGKIGTREVIGAKVSFLRHEALGAWLMEGVGARLAFPPTRVQRIAFVIAHHGRINAYEPGWSDRAVSRLIRDAGPRLDDLLAFSSADYTTKRTSKAARITANLADLRDRIAALEAPDGRWVPPKNLGDHIAVTLGVPRGPTLGAVIRWLRAEVSAGSLASDAPLDRCLAHARLHLAAQNG